MSDYRADYPGYPEQPPYGRPENKGAAPHDTYGNREIPSHDYYGHRPPKPGQDDYPPTMEPGYHLLPVPPNTWGMTTEQQLLALGGKVDELIRTFNSYDRKIYGAYDAVVNSALCNDAYYGEITVEDGYMGDTGAKYKVVHIPFTDKGGHPIYLELGVPFNNTTNAGLTENCFDASQRTIADKLIPAVNSGDGFTGLALFKKAPINGTVAPASLAAGSMGWTLGITEHGFLKLYDSANSSYQDLQWDNIRNAMGVVGVLMNNREVVKSDFMSPNHGETVARVGLGMNYDTKERFMVIVQGDDKHGCTSEMLAEIFHKYNCHIAVETANAGSAFGLDKGEMVFMPPTTDIALRADGVPNIPHVGAFWYITKRRHYRNEYVRDVANLMQRLGQGLWSVKISAASIDAIEQGLDKVENQLIKETEERKEADSDLQNQLDEEKDTRLRVDNDLYAELHALAGSSAQGDDELGGKIGELREELKKKIDDQDKAIYEKIEERVKDVKKYVDSEDAKIDALLEQYHTALDNYDIERVDTSVEGNKRTYRLIRKDGSDVQVPIEVYDYASLASNLGDIIGFEESFQNFMAEYTTWKSDLDNSIRDFKMQVANFGSRLDADEHTLASMQGTFAQIQERMSALDQSVTSFQSQMVEMELAMENLKQAWSKYYTEWLAAKTEYEQWREQNAKDMEGIQEQLNQVDSKVQEHDKKLDLLEDSIGELSDQVSQATEKNTEQDTRLDELKKDQARQDTSFNAALEYTNKRHQELVEECQTYWQKHDELEAKVKADQTLNNKRLSGLDDSVLELWDAVDGNKGSVNDLKEQALKDSVRFAELELKNQAQDAKDAEQDEHLAALDAEQDTQDGRIEALEGASNAADGRLDSMDNTVKQLQDRLSTDETHIQAVDDYNTEQDTRLDNLEQQSTTYGERFDTLGGRVDALEAHDKEIDAKDTEQDGRLAKLEGQITGDTAKDDAQDTRLEALEGQQSDLSGRLDALETEVHDINVDAYVQKSGDTMTGTLRVPEVELSDEIEFVSDGTRAKVRHGKDTDAGNLVVAEAVEDDEAVNLGQLKDELAVVEHNADTYTDKQIEDIKKDQVRQDTSFNAALEYTNKRHQELVEECQTYWQKHDELEAKVKADQTLNNKRLSGLDDSVLELWDAVDGNKGSVNDLKEQALKDSVRFAELELFKGTTESQLAAVQTFMESIQQTITTAIEGYLAEHQVPQYLELSEDGTYYKTKNNLPIAVEGE